VAAAAFGCALALTAAREAAADDELFARFACPAESPGRLRTLPDARTIPEALKHQVENAIDRLDRIGMLPAHPGLTRRAIVEVLAAIASFDEGAGAAASQPAIARRARYSERHVRDVLVYAVEVGLVERMQRWRGADRTPDGALEAVTHDRRTVYLVSLAPRSIARGADDGLLLELAAAADPPVRFDVDATHRWTWRAEQLPLGGDVEAPETAGDDGGPAAPPAPPAPPPTALPVALRDLPALLARLAEVAHGVQLDAVDVATTGQASAPDGFGLAPALVLQVVGEIADKIREGKTIPNPAAPGARWTVRGLRKRLHAFFRTKMEDGVARQREDAHQAAKDQEQREWSARAVRPVAPPAGEQLDDAGDALAATAPTESARSWTSTPAYLRGPLMRSIEQQLGGGNLAAAQRAQLERELAELRAEVPPD
jgi:hypothetical protein